MIDFREKAKEIIVSGRCHCRSKGTCMVHLDIEQALLSVHNAAVEEAAKKAPEIGKVAVSCCGQLLDVWIPHEQGGHRHIESTRDVHYDNVTKYSERLIRSLRREK